MRGYEIGTIHHFLSIDYSSKEKDSWTLPVFDYYNSVLNTYRVFTLKVISEEYECASGYENVKYVLAEESDGTKWKIDFTAYGTKARYYYPEIDNPEEIENFIAGMKKKFPQKIADEVILFGVSEMFHFYNAIHKVVDDRVLKSEEHEYYQGIMEWKEKLFEIIEQTIGEPAMIVPCKLNKTDGTVRWSSVTGDIIPVSKKPNDGPEWCDLDEYNKAFKENDIDAITKLRDACATANNYKGYWEIKQRNEEKLSQT